MRESFFQEKDVIIIESKKQEENASIRSEGRKQRRKKREANVRKIEISSKSSSKLEKEALDSKQLLNQLNPFCNFEEFLRPQQSVGSRARRRPGGVTYLDPSCTPCYTPLLVADYSPNRSYSDGLAHRHSDLR